MIYADNAATTKISSLAFEKMLPFLQDQYGNASSQYSLGVKAKRAIEQSRRQVAKVVSSEPSEIIFTSGGPEGNSWVLQSIPTIFNDEPIHIITSSIEHHSILSACSFLEKQGVEVSYLPVDCNGRVSTARLESAIRQDTKLVSIMLANNEIGTLQAISEIGLLLRERNILFHSDAVQAVGHIPISVKELHVDFLTASAHKFNGAKGTGFIFIKSGLPLPQLIYGGEQELGRRSGTEDIAGIVALGYALEESAAMMAGEYRRQKSLVQRTIEILREAIPNIQINAEHVDRLPGMLNIILPKASGESMMHLLDLKGICVSTSSACSSGNDDPSFVLLALGLSEEQARSAIRISYGRYNTLEEVEAIVSAICDAYNKIITIQ